MIWFKAVADIVCSIVVINDHMQLCERNMLDRMYNMRQSRSDAGG